MSFSFRRFYRVIKKKKRKICHAVEINKKIGYRLSFFFLFVSIFISVSFSSMKEYLKKEN